MKVLGIDLGYGDNKVAYGINGRVEKLFKFPSVVATVDINEFMSDDRVISMNGTNYYVGEDALCVESSRIKDVPDYATLEKYTPLFLYRAIQMIGENPDIIVAGLSIAQIGNSGYYRKVIEEFLQGEGIDAKVAIIPQGLGGKLTLDNYGCSFPEKPKDFTGTQNYIGIDFGFNTLDVFQVINGKAATNLVIGLENRGIVVIASRLRSFVEEKYNRKPTLKEIKTIIDTGFYRIRGHEFNLLDQIKKLKTEYLKETLTLVENQFGEILDKVERVYMFGGGSYIFSNVDNDTFYDRPEKNAEFYNAIGNFIEGCRQGEY